MADAYQREVGAAALSPQGEWLALGTVSLKTENELMILDARPLP
ncbi:MAG: hypothetical protein U0792_02500 [Gemmataceae bacterium]